MNKETLNDTIAAIATAPGEAGIAVVRVSGPGSLALADRLFRAAGEPPSRMATGTFRHGFIRPPGDPAAEDLDEVLLLVFRAPHSYTGEDAVEIQGHGGRICAQRILRAALNAGARPAEPGEFTRRAFLNGRIDLLQAEAVLDLVQADTEHAASMAVEQLEGRLTGSFAELYDTIMSVACDLEASLDFVEDELPATVPEDIGRRLDQAREACRALLATWEEGRVWREGVRVVIAGRPNVGKSTLFNRLLGHERVIVTDLPGTTRDTIEEGVVLEGVPLRLVDTAGLRDTLCRIEQIGIRKAHESISRAQLVLYVLDASGPKDAADTEAVRRLSSQALVLVLNKIDKGQETTAATWPGQRTVPCSLLTGQGLNDLRAAILDILSINPATPPHATISERHFHCVQYTVNAINEAMAALQSFKDEGFVIAAQHLRNGLESMGRVTGRTYDNELLDGIFSKFCIGK